MRDGTIKLLSTVHTVLYRATDGWLGRRLVANDMLLLTTAGRHTGRKHTVPLLYLSEGDRLVVVASWGGRDYHPEWYLNLVANREVEVQILGRNREVTATTMSAEERAEWWPRIVAAYDGYAAYSRRTDREIPVIWLDPRTREDTA